MTTAELLPAIRERRRAGMNYGTIARELGTSRTRVWNICWKNQIGPFTLLERHTQPQQPVDRQDTKCRTCGDGHADQVTELCRWCMDPLVNEPEPTGALPGTAEKMAVLAERIRQRQRLWCDGDGKRDETKGV